MKKIAFVLAMLSFMGCGQKEAKDFRFLPRNVRENFDFDKTNQMLNQLDPNCGDYKFYKTHQQTFVNILMVFKSQKKCPNSAFLLTVDKETLEIVLQEEKSLQ